MPPRNLPPLGPDQRRRLQRGVRALGRRIRNAGITFLIMLALIIAGIAGGYLGIITTFLALIATFVATVVVLFWPSSGRDPEDTGMPTTPGASDVIDARATVRLDRLAAQAGDWLAGRRRMLPKEVRPALDRIQDRLRDLEPALAGVSSDTQIGGEAQRLIGQHLPGLVNTYNGLPPPERQKGSDADRILADRLDVVADELDHLCERVGCEKRARFDTQSRFIESRYRDGGLSLDKG